MIPIQLGPPSGSKIHQECFQLQISSAARSRREGVCPAPPLSSSPVRLGGSLPSDSCPYGEGWAGWGLRAGRDEAAEPQRRKQMGPRLNRFVLSRPAFATHTQLCPQMSQKRP